MKAIILAAGKGTRLGSMTLNCPKPMVSVAGVPLLERLLRWVALAGITDVAINLHYLPDVISSFVGDGSRYGVRVSYSHETTLMGSAGALLPLRSFFGPDDFVVVYGDVLTDVSLDALCREHASSGADFTMLLTQVEDPTRAGIVEVDERGWVKRFVEKPAADGVFSDLANAGIYVCSAAIWPFVPNTAFSDFGVDVIPALLAAGARVRGVSIPGTVIDIGSPERLAEANEWVARGGQNAAGSIQC